VIATAIASTSAETPAIRIVLARERSKTGPVADAASWM